jgi:RNA polymerase primary sigma factor
MQRIKNYSLEQLLMQLRFTPQSKQRKQLEGAENLLSIIDKGREYPFEFVCFKITGFRPSEQIEWQPIKGEELIDDLRIFISKLSSQIAPPAWEQGEKVSTIEELSRELLVSTKTINRWRKRGLVALKFIFDDGEKRFGFLDSTVAGFLKEHPDLAARARKFARLTKKERQQIVKRAMSLAARTGLSRYQVINKIAEKFGRAHETIRYVIANYEKTNPDRHIFGKPAGVVSPAEGAEIYRLYKQGGDIKELISRFHRTKSSIYRIIKLGRAKAILARKIEYIASEEFSAVDAEQKILASPIAGVKLSFRKNTEPPQLTGSSFDRYQQALNDAPVLNREQEVELFRRCNYLKYLAFTAREGMRISSVPSARLNKIERYLAQAETIRKMIIEANLRLVVSIANKHFSSRVNMADLVSEGNLSLMQAAEKFDYTKGFRFSTYATWAITKDYARRIPEEAGRLDKAGAASLENVQRDFRTTMAAGVVAIERARESLVQVIKDNLDEREQYIIMNHYGLVGSSIKKQKKTFLQIGQDLGMSKERARQLELIALQKLKHLLSMEEFEMLTG